MKRYTSIEMKDMVIQLFENGNLFIKKGKTNIINLEKQIKEAKRKIGIVNEAIELINEDK